MIASTQKGYRISTERSILRMSDEDGEQEVIVKKMGGCSEARWKQVREALISAAQRQQ